MSIGARWCMVPLKKRLAPEKQAIRSLQPLLLPTSFHGCIFCAPVDVGAMLPSYTVLLLLLLLLLLLHCPWWPLGIPQLLEW